MDINVAIFVTALAVFWIVVYALYRDKEGKVEVHLGYIIARAGLSLEPMEEGVKARLWTLFGWISLFTLILAGVAFYYYTFNLFILRYINPPPCTSSVVGFVPFIPGVTMSLEATIYILITLGIAALVHEMAHAYVARAVGLKIKDAGIAFFLFIPGAFVEPDEEELEKAPTKKKLLVFSAGVGANTILAIIALFLAGAMVSGAVISGVAANSPAELAGLEPGMKIISINGTKVENVGDVIKILESMGVQDPAKTVTMEFLVEKDGITNTIIVHRPGNETADKCVRGRIGITLENAYWPSKKLGILVNFLFLINISLAIINAAPLVLPLPGGSIFADGAYVLKEILQKFMTEKTATITTIAVGSGTLLLVISLMSLQRIM